MSDSKKIDVLTILTLAALTVAGTYSFYIDRYLYWFPEWFVLSLQKGIIYDIPRYSFSIFQLPSLILKWMGADDYVRLKSIGLALSLYPVVCLFFCWKFLKRTVNKNFLYPILLCFLTFYTLTSAPSFNGALHSFGLFWVLASILVGNYAGKLRIVFSFLYILFIFFYPPASAIGSIFLLWYYFKNKNGKDYNFYLLLTGSVLSVGYLIFFKFFSAYPIYTETIWGLKATIFSPLALLFILLTYFFFRFKFSKGKRVYFHILLIIFLGFHLHENWNIFILSHQYHYRFFLYTLGFIPIFFIDNFLEESFLEQKLLNLFAVFLVLIFLGDLRASYTFQKDIDLLQSIATRDLEGQKCPTLEPLTSLVSNYPDIGSLSYLIPRVSGGQRVLLPKKHYTNDLFKDFCKP